MHRFVILSLGFALAAHGRTAGAAVSRAVDALGGAQRFAKVHSIRVHGTLDGAKITVAAQRPSLFHMDLETPDGIFSQISDGTRGWQKSGTAASSELDGAALNSLLDQARNAIGGPLIETRARGNQVELEGHATVDGKDCIKLKVTLTTKNVMLLFMDAATWLEIREELGDVEETVGDYRRFGGVLFPCKYVSKSKGDTQSHALRIDSIEINPRLPQTAFSRP